MEIERKFLVNTDGIDIKAYPSKELEQGYLATDPVVRVRREGEEYYLTYKSGYGMVRVEENLPLTKESYEHLLAKADGYVITKRRYRIPVEVFFEDGEMMQDTGSKESSAEEIAKSESLNCAADGVEEFGGSQNANDPSELPAHLPDGKTVELDVFSGEFDGVVVAEIEFPTKEAADAFVMPKRFHKDVTFDPCYINSEMSKNGRAGSGDEGGKA